MNCAEFQRVLPETIEGGGNAEHQAHLNSCPECSGLVSDLNAISQTARLLRASEEPSPRVWNSIEISLRREGLIRQPQRDRSVTGRSSWRWSPAWLAPVAAALLIVFGVIIYQRGPAQPSQVAENRAPAVPTQAVNLQTAVNRANDDQQVLDALGSKSPAMRADYAANLQNVNDYIRDAEESAQTDPNDEEAQQSLMDAYDQRAMVYDMALDRSMP
ncbi:MAG TPA: anti-sigma factor [Terriglobales bacterium]|nr:anti-sigma factor [Terriglobales bacterium]